MTMSVFARRAGIPETVIPTSSSCTAVERWAKSKLRWSDSDDPEQGDYVEFEDYDDIPNDSDHVGYVIKVTPSRIYCVEGNNGNNPNKIIYVDYPRNFSHIRGYFKPAYAEEVVETVNLKGKTTAEDGLNIRTGAGTTFGAMGSYPLGSAVAITQKAGNWGKTDKGWICLDYVLFDTPTATTNRNPDLFYDLDDVKRKEPSWLPEIEAAVANGRIRGDGRTQLGGKTYSELMAVVFDERGDEAMKSRIDALEERLAKLEKRE